MPVAVAFIHRWIFPTFVASLLLLFSQLICCFKVLFTRVEDAIKEVTDYSRCIIVTNILTVYQDTWFVRSDK